MTDFPELDGEVSAERRTATCEHCETTGDCLFREYRTGYKHEVSGWYCTECVPANVPNQVAFSTTGRVRKVARGLAKRVPRDVALALQARTDRINSKYG